MGKALRYPQQGRTIVNTVNPLRPSEYSVEDDIRSTLRSVKTSVSNAVDNMAKMHTLLNNGITHAHDDVGAALDKVRDEIHQQVAKVDKLIDDYKGRLHAGGQEIAVTIEGVMQELKRTAEWLEEQTPRIRKPKLELPAPKSE